LSIWRLTADTALKATWSAEVEFRMRFESSLRICSLILNLSLISSLALYRLMAILWNWQGKERYPVRVWALLLLLIYKELSPDPASDYAAARARSQVRSCGICAGQSGTGAGFLRVLRFPLPILIPPTTPHSSAVIRGWYNRPNIGRRTKWTQSHPTPRN
jgi:hypothetical protein